jgi:hypothetical protein
MREIVIVKVAAIELLRGWPVEGIGRGLADEGGRELSFALRQ